MYSRGHALVAGVVGIPIAVGAQGEFPGLLWIYVLLLGVGIDVDHFVIARLNRGDWANVRRVLRNPTQVFRDQSALFARGDVWRDERLLSHLLIGGALTAGWWTVDHYWALATALTIYTHVLADLYADIRTRPEYLEGDHA
jgi:hypothetical protein